jgi:Zn-dependent protease
LIKKLIFGLIWFAVIFIISYAIGGYIYMKTTGVVPGGGFQAGLEAGRAARSAYRQTYLIYIMLGSLILATIGTATGILPGTGKKAAKGKRANAKKKARRKSK